MQLYMWTRLGTLHVVSHAWSFLLTNIPHGIFANSNITNILNFINFKTFKYERFLVNKYSIQVSISKQKYRLNVMVIIYYTLVNTNCYNAWINWKEIILKVNSILDSNHTGQYPWNVIVYSEGQHFISWSDRFPENASPHFHRYHSVPVTAWCSTQGRCLLCWQ